MADSQRDPPPPEKKKSDSPDKQPPQDPTSSSEKRVTFSEKIKIAEESSDTEAENSSTTEAGGGSKKAATDSSKKVAADKSKKAAGGGAKKAAGGGAKKAAESSSKKSRKPLKHVPLAAPVKSALKKSRSSSDSSAGSPLTSPPPAPGPSFGDQLVGIPPIDSEEVEQPMEEGTSEELQESHTNQPENESQGPSKRRKPSRNGDASPEDSSSLSDLRTLEGLELSDQSSLDVTDDAESEASGVFSPAGTPQSPPATTSEADRKLATSAEATAPLASPDNSSLISTATAADQSIDRPGPSSSSAAADEADILLTVGGYRKGLFRSLSTIREEKTKSPQKRKRIYSSDDKDSATSGSSGRSSPVLRNVTKCIKEIRDKFSPPRTTRAVQTDDPSAPERDSESKTFRRPSKILRMLDGPKTSECSTQTIGEFDLKAKDEDEEDMNEDRGDPAPSKLETSRKPDDDDEGSHGSAALMV